MLALRQIRAAANSGSQVVCQPACCIAYTWITILFAWAPITFYNTLKKCLYQLVPLLDPGTYQEEQLSLKILNQHQVIVVHRNVVLFEIGYTKSTVQSHIPHSTAITWGVLMVYPPFLDKANISNRIHLYTITSHPTKLLPAVLQYDYKRTTIV